MRGFPYRLGIMLGAFANPSCKYPMPFISDSHGPRFMGHGMPKLAREGCKEMANALLEQAAHQAPPASRRGMLERIFTPKRASMAWMLRPQCLRRRRQKYARPGSNTASLFGAENFDHVLFSYSLSMIPDWPGALAAGISALSGDGRWHVVDFADLKGLGLLGRWTLTAWLKTFHVSPRVEFLAMLEGVSPERGALTLLAGRYAFVYRSAPKQIWESCPSPCGAPTTAFS
jgi:hypothetical protein